MPRHLTLLERKQQPIYWGRAVWVGILGALLMMAWVDTFYAIGWTSFSFELYLGALFRGTPYGVHNWTVGLMANLVVGAVFGVFYGYFFEYVYLRAGVKTGLKVALWHLLVAALAVFPFFGALHEFAGTGLYPHFGILGAGLGWFTPVLLVLGHLFFGATQGLFYGGVKMARAREAEFEPGETGVPPELGGITSEEDPADTVTAVYRGG